MAPFDELTQAELSRHRVERLLAHFRRFLAPDDKNILKLEQRLSSLTALTAKAAQESASYLGTPHRI